jgi:hypothetical protein
MSELAHWDCWGSCGMRHVDRWPQTVSQKRAAVGENGTIQIQSPRQ